MMLCQRVLAAYSASRNSGFLAAGPVAVIAYVVRRYLDGGAGAPVIDAAEAAGVLHAGVVQARDLGGHAVSLFLESDYAFVFWHRPIPVLPARREPKSFRPDSTP